MDRTVPTPIADDEATALARQWIAFTQRRHPETGDLARIPAFSLPAGVEAPVRILSDLLLSDPLYMTEVLSAVWSLSDDEWVLACLGGGPLEDLLWLGDAHVNALVEMEAATHPNARRALASVWVERLPPVSARLVRRVLGPAKVVQFKP
jgi:hypothetical protein